MRYLLLLLALTGCTAVPVDREFPPVPDRLKLSCDALTTVAPDATLMSDFLPVVAENYGKYHECKIKVDLWLDWYKTQKKIFDDTQ